MLDTDPTEARRSARKDSYFGVRSSDTISERPKHTRERSSITQQLTARPLLSCHVDSRLLLSDPS